ncbi:MAG: phosphomethylpyrimidine synthase ThiC [Candidatus Methanomethylicia archaeon]
MTGLMIAARSGSTPEEVVEVARIEGLSPDVLRQRLSRGVVVIPKNSLARNRRIVGIGEGLRTKVNVNIGTSTFHVDLGMELEKVKIALKYGTDTLMDLSVGGDLKYIRREILKILDVPFGTVPIYQAYMESVRKHHSGIDMSEDDVFRVLEEHYRDGVDFVTVHVGLTRELAEKTVKIGRRTGIVSRGGAILAAWMLHNEQENPLYKNYDYLLELSAQYDVVLSLGDALRPGSIMDSHDYPQVAEMINVSQLVKRAWEKGVQVMVEGPGHLPINQIAANVRLEKSLCHGAPYYVLGPLVTDIAAGYDHIAAAIGAALAAAEGADLICYLTPAEHLSLPTPEDVKDGLIAAKIAAHAGDIVKLGEKALRIDIEMSSARAKLDWETMYKLSPDPQLARDKHKKFKEVDVGPCTMCGDMCVYVILNRFRGA